MHCSDVHLWERLWGTTALRILRLLCCVSELQHFKIKFNIRVVQLVFTIRQLTVTIGNQILLIWPSMWLDNNRICDVLQDLICVPDVLISVMMCTWLHFSVYVTFSTGKLIFIMPFTPLLFTCSVVFDIYRASFGRLYT